MIRGSFVGALAVAPDALYDVAFLPLFVSGGAWHYNAFDSQPVYVIYFWKIAFISTLPLLVVVIELSIEMLDVVMFRW